MRQFYLISHSDDFDCEYAMASTRMMIEPGRGKLKIFSTDHQKLVSLISIGNKDFSEAANVDTASTVLGKFERHPARFVPFALDLGHLLE